MLRNRGVVIRRLGIGIGCVCLGGGIYAFHHFHIWQRFGWEWLGTVLSSLTDLATFGLAALGGYVAVNPPTREEIKSKTFYVVSFGLLAILGVYANGSEREKDKSEKRVLQQEQTDAEIRFSDDLKAVKQSSDAILAFVANPPKGISQNQFSSTLSALLAKRDQIAAVPKDICDYSNDGLRAMGQLIIPLLSAKANALVDAENVWEAAHPNPQDREEHHKRFKSVIDSFNNDPANRKLFANANHLNECVLIRLNKQHQEEGLFGIVPLYGGAKAFYFHTVELEDSIKQLSPQ
jgi:hypothetical protein